MQRAVQSSSRIPSPQEIVDSLRRAAPFEVEIPFDFRASGSLAKTLFTLDLFKTDPNYAAVIRRFRYTLLNPEVAEIWRLGVALNGSEIPGPFRVARYTSDDLPGKTKSVAGNGFMPRDAMAGEEEQGFDVDGSKQVTLVAKCAADLLGVLPGDMAPVGYVYVAGMQFSREAR